MNRFDDLLIKEVKSRPYMYQSNVTREIIEKREKFYDNFAIVIRENPLDDVRFNNVSGTCSQYLNTVVFQN